MQGLLSRSGALEIVVLEFCSFFLTQVLQAAVGFKVSCWAEDFQDLGRGCGGSELAEGCAP